MNWEQFFQQEQQLPYYQELMKFLEQEYATKVIYPPKDELFSVFHLCPYDSIKVVILGQDPYHQPNQAHGLAFSVGKDVKIPPSLRNIYKELQTDLGIAPCQHGNLEGWARQGVFLMNAVMSVEAGKAGSHRKKGWEIFSDHAIHALNEHPAPLVFILWGNWAIQKQALISNPAHKILCAPHPSPLSAYHGFFGSRPFSQANAFLQEQGRAPIDWSCL